jgi:SP family galactose:H+ symporter-like MFS transporter
MTVGFGLAIAQQITSINTVIYYFPTIFKFADLSSASVAILASVGVGVVNVALTVVAMQLIDRVGRRPLLLVSLAEMTLSLAVLGLAFGLPQLSGSLDGSRWRASWYMSAHLPWDLGRFSGWCFRRFTHCASEVGP